MHILIHDPRFLLFHSEAEYTKADLISVTKAWVVAYWCPPVRSYVIVKDRYHSNYGKVLSTVEMHDLINNMEGKYDPFP